MLLEAKRVRAGLSSSHVSSTEVSHGQQTETHPLAILLPFMHAWHLLADDLTAPYHLQCDILESLSSLGGVSPCWSCNRCGPVLYLNAADSTPVEEVQCDMTDAHKDSTEFPGQCLQVGPMPQQFTKRASPCMTLQPPLWPGNHL